MLFASACVSLCPASTRSASSCQRFAGASVVDATSIMILTQESPVKCDPSVSSNGLFSQAVLPACNELGTTGAGRNNGADRDLRPRSIALSVSHLVRWGLPGYV